MTDEERNEMTDEAPEEEEEATAAGAEQDKGVVHPQPDPVRDY